VEIHWSASPPRGRSLTCDLLSVYWCSDYVVEGSVLSDISSRRLPAGGTPPVQSVGRAMDLLQRVAGAGPEGVTLTELSRATGLKPTTVHSLLRSLQFGDYLEQTPGTAGYRLGAAVLQLAGAYLQGDQLIRLLDPVLERLHRQTGETVQLGRLHGDHHVTVRVLLSTHAVVAAPAVISEPRLYCTALGKVLLAATPPETTAALTDGIERRGFVAYGPTTITSRGALLAELERVRRAGYASNYEEGRPGVIGQAAPVRDFAGTTVAALGVAYPSLRRSPDYDRRMIDQVMQAASEASRRCGWSAGTPLASSGEGTLP
jgi:DNA-binding IclR family transcriptional regulator